MEQPPVMISGKDLMYISDILTQQITFIKKFDTYKDEIVDNEISDLVYQITEGLKTETQTLLEVLNA